MRISTVLILSPASSDLGMATVLEGDVKKNLLERTEAEKVFRPWWDTLEDCLLNTLIVIGELIILLQLLRVTTNQHLNISPAVFRVQIIDNMAQCLLHAV